MSLNKNMRELLSFVRTLAGTSGHEHGFYTECGPGKPWSVRTVKALAKRGLVRVMEPERFGYRRRMGHEWSELKLTGYVPESGYYYVLLTAAGDKLFSKGGK